MMDMIKNLEFKRVNNEFQSNLTNDIRQIRKRNNLSVPAEKFRNIYKVSNADTKSLSRHEQVCLIRLRFERYFSHHRVT